MMWTHERPVATDTVPADQALKIWIEWYLNHGAYARRFYYGSEVLVVFFASLIPACAVFTSNAQYAAAFGVIVVILTGVRSIFRWQDTWMRTNNASGQLEGEASRYVERRGSYADDDREWILRQRIQEIVDWEMHTWVSSRMAGKPPSPE